MPKLLGWLFSKTDEHVSDEQLIAAIDADCPRPLSANAGRHLERCWQCLARKEQLKDTIFKVVDYQQQLLAEFLPPPARGEERFLTRLDSQIESARHGFWPRLVKHLRSLGSLPMNPVFASVLVVVLAISSLLVIWRRSTPAISANAFFENGEKWDKNPGDGEPGVVYQRIRISTPQQTVERAVYRDVQRRRRPRTDAPKPDEGQLTKQLSEAGVSWTEPLSVEGFQRWHDQQRVTRDQVRSGGDLLTLTTDVEGSSVANQSLTLRKSDFHPVGRRIQFRTAGTIEIAELDYAVLGWNAVNDSIFEPLESSPPVSPRPLMVGALLTRAELDEAELEARVILSRLNADSREQLEFSRSNQAIIINGVVETNERKHDLLSQLRPLPHVVASIFSLEELDDRRLSGRSSVSSVQAYSAEVAGPSPLEQWLRQSGKPQAEVSSISQQILDEALAVQQDSSALNELLQRFAPDSHLSESARKALGELTQRHYKNLMAELDREEKIMRELGSLSAQGVDSVRIAKEDELQTLTAAAARNRSLCSELISGAQSGSRPGQMIGSEILAYIEEIRRIASNSRTAAASAAGSGSPAQNP
jgi:hypothetical protein